MKENKIKLFDLYKTRNGNLFLKINSTHSIALGPRNCFDDIKKDSDIGIINNRDGIKVKKLGKLKLKK